MASGRLGAWRSSLVGQAVAVLSLLMNAALLFSHVADAAPTTYDVDWSATSSSSNIFTAIAVGDTVRWTWRDSLPHSIKSTTQGFSFGSAQGAEASVVAQNGFQFSYTFTKAGAYGYTCKIHGSMTGTVLVAGSPTIEVVYVVPWSLSSPFTTTTIQTGDSVRWVWGDGSPHTVKSTTEGFSFGTGVAGAESYPIAQKGFQFTYKFDKPGTYNYTCLYHSNMRGTVVVGPTGGLPSPPPAPSLSPQPAAPPPPKRSPPPTKSSFPPPTNVLPPPKLSIPPPKSSPPPPKSSPPPPKKSPPPPKTSSPPPKKSPPPPKKKPPPPKK